MKILSFIITNLCNMNCAFCLRGKDKASIDLKLMKRILEEAKTLGYDTIALTGGEAFMHPKFKELIDLIVKEGFDFTIVSNAKNYEKYIPALKTGKLKIITFSLDGKPQTHDSWRGKGSYDKVIEAIKYFSGKTFVIAAMCINKYNMNEISDVLFAAEKAGAKQLNYSSVIPTGENDPFVLSDREREECLKLVNSLKSRTKLKIVTLSALRTLDKVEFCRALDLSSMTVNPHGKLTFCCDTTGNGAILGDLKKQKLSKLIVKGMKLSNFLKQKKHEQLTKGKTFPGCDTCWFCNKFLEKYKEK